MTFLLAFTLFASQAPAPAQAPIAADGPIATARGAFLAISVADLEASSRWYAEKFGLKRTMDVGRTGRMGGVVVLEGDGWIVELIKHDDSIRPAASSPELVQGFMKAGAVVADFDRAVRQLRARHVEIVVGPFPARESARANLIFKDNAGNLIQLFGDYARK